MSSSLIHRETLDKSCLSAVSSVRAGLRGGQAFGGSEKPVKPNPTSWFGSETLAGKASLSRWIFTVVLGLPLEISTGLRCRRTRSTGVQEGGMGL